MAAELIAQEGLLQGIVLSIKEGERWVLGRDPASCQLVIEDPSCPRQALQLLQTEEGYRFEGVGDERIELNGELVKEALLQSGDTLKIGETLFLFQEVEEFEEVIFSESGEEPTHVDSTIDFVGEPGEEGGQQDPGEASEEFSEESFSEGESVVKEEDPQEEALAHEGADQSVEPDRFGEGEAFHPEGPDGDIQEEKGSEETFDHEGIDQPKSESKESSEELSSEGEDEQRREEESAAEELTSEGLEKDPDQEPGQEMAAEGSDRDHAPLQGPKEERLAGEGYDQEGGEPRDGSSEDLLSDGVEQEPPQELPEELIAEGEEAEQWLSTPHEELHGGDEEQLSSEGMETTPAHPQGEEFEEELFSEKEVEEEPLFAPDESLAGMTVDLAPSIRFLLKVIAGPNTGAEFALEMGSSYLIGTEASTCQIIFHDLSVSREHAKLYLSEAGALEIEDLGSRNGILVDQDQITGRVPLAPNVVVTIGTSAFFVVDREAPQETIIAPAFEPPKVESQEEIEEVEEPQEEPALAEVEAKPEAKPGMGIYISIVSGLAVLLAICMVSLFNTKDLQAPPKDYVSEIREATQDFPGVKYTYSPANSRLFLVGHVATGIEKDELFYNLHTLNFLKGIDDHVVNDEAVWQEMNILLSKQEMFKGVSMHSPRPALFVLNGYLKSEKQAAELTDWINIHFNYLSLLENRVVVEEQIIEEVSTLLVQNGFGAITVSFLGGELTLAGYVGSTQSYEYERLVDELMQLPGVRQLQNFVVVVAPEQQVIDLNQRYPGRFKVTGYSKHGDVSINVVINGHILSRGDVLDGMTLTSIQPHAVFFDKDGLKYKLEYNK